MGLIMGTNCTKVRSFICYRSKYNLMPIMELNMGNMEVAKIKLVKDGEVIETTIVSLYLPVDSEEPLPERS